MLQQLGFGALQARQTTLKFRIHNIKTLLAKYPFYKDQKTVVSMAKQARDGLQEMFSRDAQLLAGKPRDGWN